MLPGVVSILFPLAVDGGHVCEIMIDADEPSKVLQLMPFGRPSHAAEHNVNIQT